MDAHLHDHRLAVGDHVIIGDQRATTSIRDISDPAVRREKVGAWGCVRPEGSVEGRSVEVVVEDVGVVPAADIGGDRISVVHPDRSCIGGEIDPDNSRIRCSIGLLPVVEDDAVVGDEADVVEVALHPGAVRVPRAERNDLAVGIPVDRGRVGDGDRLPVCPGGTPPGHLRARDTPEDRSGVDLDLPELGRLGVDDLEQPGLPGVERLPIRSERHPFRPGLLHRLGAGDVGLPDGEGFGSNVLKDNTYRVRSVKGNFFEDGTFRNSVLKGNTYRDCVLRCNVLKSYFPVFDDWDLDAMRLFLPDEPLGQGGILLPIMERPRGQEVLRSVEGDRTVGGDLEDLDEGAEVRGGIHQTDLEFVIAAGGGRPADILDPDGLGLTVIDLKLGFAGAGDHARGACRWRGIHTGFLYIPGIYGGIGPGRRARPVVP
ncbi:hypothetical protein DSECCO2_533060 [anaerobic digester metagenome]